jgi:3-hydroxy-9,10-secoandrosta-1,3,5(10)-triene-9,17-dione monooxygenase reductase component
MSSSEEQKRAFRNALGSFATGVTIATTSDAEGRPIGVTASSFNSVSLDPPLVLWSLAKSSSSREAFCCSGHFAVHVLANSQEGLSNKFARSGDDKFKDVAWKSGVAGSPVLDTYASVFECRTRHQYEGGDHLILVGEVVSFDQRDEDPLLFHGGGYAEKRSRPDAAELQAFDPEIGQHSENFLFYLVSRAYFQATKSTREWLAAKGSNMSEYLTLGALSYDAPAGYDDVRARLSHTGHIPNHENMSNLRSDGLIAETKDGFALTEAGRDLWIGTLAYGKSLEEDLADHFTPAELAECKRVLRKVIELSAGER